MLSPFEHVIVLKGRNFAVTSVGTMIATLQTPGSDHTLNDWRRLPQKWPARER